jgi:hypothetical protein
MTRIRTIDRKSRNSAEELLALGIPGQVVATDFYLDGAEAWEAVPGGLAHPSLAVICVDHHAPVPSMQRRVSSANLALTRLESGLAPDADADAVVINHMDCDSVLASGILAGRLEPDPAYGVAAIAADHTGEENPVADLLQGLDAHWSRSRKPMPDAEGLEFFFDSLSRFQRGRSLDTFAREAMDVRKESRERAGRIVAEGRFHAEAGVCFATLDEPLEGELLLPFLDEAVMVATANRHREYPDRWQLKIRLGLAAPEGLSLQAMEIEAFDPGYGGRWNAGSNSRGGGTDIEPEAYRQRLVGAVAAYGRARREEA